VNYANLSTMHRGLCKDLHSDPRTNPLSRETLPMTAVRGSDVASPFPRLVVVVHARLILRKDIGAVCNTDLPIRKKEHCHNTASATHIR